MNSILPWYQNQIKTYKKENNGSVCLINTNTKILSKTCVNSINDCIKRPYKIIKWIYPGGRGMIQHQYM